MIERLEYPYELSSVGEEGGTGGGGGGLAKSCYTTLAEIYGRIFLHVTTYFAHQIDVYVKVMHCVMFYEPFP